MYVLGTQNTYIMPKGQGGIAADKRSIHIIFFLILHKSICCGYSLEVPRWGASNEHHNICIYGEIRKISVLFGWKKCLIWWYEHDLDVYVTVGWYFAFRICLEDGFCMVQLIFLKSVLTEALVLFIFLYKFKILFGTTLNSHMMARNNNNLTCIYQAVLPYIRRVIYPKYLDRQACADSVDLVRCHGLWHLLKVYTFCPSFGCILVPSTGS